jgi:transposase
MDNLSAYKKERVRDPIEGRGYELLYPPSYSTDLDPTEEAFSKKKAETIKRFSAKSFRIHRGVL